MMYEFVREIEVWRSQAVVTDGLSSSENHGLYTEILRYTSAVAPR